jgi:pimeloyl-ACP methyl ester carboxylesterase
LIHGQPQSKKPMSFLKRLFRILISIFIIMPLLSSAILYTIQDRLLFPLPKMDNNLLQWARQNYPDSEVQLTTPDNVKLHGWFVKDKGSPYRSAGLSEGQPSEENLYKDALFLYDTFSTKQEVDKTQIVAFGRSLGTGVAVYLASQRPLRGVILVSPFDSVRSIAQGRYFFVPVFLLLKHPFDSLALAPSIKVPMLAILATEDRVISPSHSRRLIQAWGGQTSLKEIGGVGHNDIQEGEGYWGSIKEFLRGVKAL